MEKGLPGQVEARAIQSRLWRTGPLAVAVALVATLALIGRFGPGTTIAQSANCSQVQNPLRLPIADCTFTNQTSGNVNDIHMVFYGLVIKLSSNPDSSCAGQFVLHQGRLDTSVNCRFTSRPPSGVFSIRVLYAQLGGPNVDTWYWTLNGTPVATTPTGTVVPTNTPRPTSTNTPRPTSTNTPPATSTSTAVNTSTPTRTATPTVTPTATLDDSQIPD